MPIDEHSDAALEVSKQAEYNHYLTDAPIAEFANFAGISVDEAVNRRVEAVKAAAPLIMDVTVRPIEPKKNLVGFASVKSNNGFVVDDFKVLQSEKGLFVGNPSRPDGKGGYKDTARPITKECHAQLAGAIETAYHAAVQKAQARAAALTEAEKKVPMKEQFAKGAKEAAAHNAKRPDPAMSGRAKPAAEL